MSGQKPRFPQQRPIFVGASARRLRGLRTAGAMVLVPAAGFVAVLLIALVAELLIPSPLLPFAAPQKTAVVPVQPRPEPKPEPATSTTAYPVRLTVVAVVSTRELAALAPPRAASPLSNSKRRPVKVTPERKVVAKRRPAVVAKATPRGRAAARPRPAVALSQAKGKAGHATRPVAKRGPTAVPAEVKVTGKPVVKRERSLADSAKTLRRKATARADSLTAPKPLTFPVPQRPPAKAGR